MSERHQPAICLSNLFCAFHTLCVCWVALISSSLFLYYNINLGGSVFCLLSFCWPMLLWRRKRSLTFTDRRLLSSLLLLLWLKRFCLSFVFLLFLFWCLRFDFFLSVGDHRYRKSFNQQNELICMRNVLLIVMSYVRHSILWTEQSQSRREK